MTQEITIKLIVQKLSLKCPSVPGRMEFVGNTRNSASVYIDFAHTPDALQNALIEGGNLCKSELHIVLDVVETEITQNAQ